MSGPNLALSSSPIVSRCNLDLEEEARQFFRQRFRVAGIGILLGFAFIGIGVFEVGGITRPPGNFFDAVDQRHAAARACVFAIDVHRAISAAAFTDSRIFT